MSQHQGFSSIALIIIVLLVLGGGYWVWQKENNKIPPPVIYTNEQVDAANDTNIEPPSSSDNSFTTPSAPTPIDGSPTSITKNTCVYSESGELSCAVI